MYFQFPATFILVHVSSVYSLNKYLQHIPSPAGAEKTARNARVHSRLVLSNPAPDPHFCVTQNSPCTPALSPAHPRPDSLLSQVRTPYLSPNPWPAWGFCSSDLPPTVRLRREAEQNLSDELNDESKCRPQEGGGRRPKEGEQTRTGPGPGNT